MAKKKQGSLEVISSCNETQARLNLVKLLLIVISILMLVNIGARIVYDNKSSVKYIESQVDSPYGRVKWEGTEYLVDKETGVIYSENKDLSMQLYEDNKNKTYKYNVETNEIEEIIIP